MSHTWCGGSKRSSHTGWKEPTLKEEGSNENSNRNCGVGYLTVGASSVKNNLKRLRWGSDGDIRVIYALSVWGTPLPRILGESFGLTLRVQEVLEMKLVNEGEQSRIGATYIKRNAVAAVHGHVTTISDFEHLLGVLLGADAHVFLAESPHLGIDIVVGLAG